MVMASGLASSNKGDTKPAEVDSRLFAGVPSKSTLCLVINEPN
jgi:hypothetical protein